MNFPFAKAILFVFVAYILGLSLFVTLRDQLPPRPPTPTPQEKISPTSTLTPSVTPTPKPLTFAEMNTLYGPCVNLPVLMYHHIQESETAKTNGNGYLTVTPATFESHLAYLNDSGYISITPAQLIGFFDSGTSLPNRPILLTFDDGYDDFANKAAPLLSRYSIKASVFLPTGLLENPGYLNWNSISSLAGQGVYFGNHTWSHRSMGNNADTNKREIVTAETQLADHGLDQNKVFVYPYGAVSDSAVAILRGLGYKLAFTTVPGRIACAKRRLTIPRIRIGNSPLSGYGL
jgi:peptidoglycan/xylan/chitin deacetylase (PgdA/CDA1 family)